MTAHSDMPTGGSPDNPTSITDLLGAYRAAHDAFAEADQASVARYHDALHAVRDARPTDPRALATLLRWIVTDQDDLLQDPLGEILVHVAGQLEDTFPLDLIEIEIARARTLLDLGEQWMNANAGKTGVADDVWIYVEVAMRRHLDRIDELAGEG